MRPGDTAPSTCLRFKPILVDRLMTRIAIPAFPILCLLPLFLGACVASNRPGTIPIGEVQGSGAQSPVLGESVVVEGIVVEVSAEGLGGFFIEDPTGDGELATSDGLFVLLAPGAAVPDVNELVRVAGTVVELGDGETTLTALDDPEITLLGQKMPPPPIPVNAPPPGGNWERYEAMLVTIPADLTISGTNAFSRFGELTASFDGRLYAPTEVASPGDAARTEMRNNDIRRLLLDDSDVRELTSPPSYFPSGASATAPLRTGSVVRGATGVLDQRRGQYRLQLTVPLEGRVQEAARPPAPSVPGDVRMASLNVLNLFNGDGRGGGFPTERGAETAADFDLQQDKLVASVQALAPDVAALMEIENDGYGPNSALAEFVASLNEAGPISDFRFVNAGKGPGTDQIRVALIYRGSRLQLVGDPAVLEGGPFSSLSRVPIAQAFRRGNGPAFVVVAIHFKSKGCGRNENAAKGADADQRDGQGCWNPVRVESARRVNSWLKTQPGGVQTDLRVLIGDFNAYAMEDPIRTLTDYGWLDAFSVAEVPYPYSYVFDGQAGRLDHALLSPALAARLRGAAEWHNNSDELQQFSYFAGGDRGPYRASDHDPFLLGFELGE